MKKRFFTLLEVIIALFLAAILLTFLFNFFSEITFVEKKMLKASEKVLFKNTLKVKLNTLFSQIIERNSIDQMSSKLSFYTLKDENGLCFIYDNGIDPNSSFSSLVFAKLYLKEKNLILETHPLEYTIKKDKSQNYREEILAKNVSALSFSFLEKIKPKTPKEKAFATSSFWDKDHMPISLKISLTIENEPLSFTFFLPSRFSITYVESNT